MGEKMKRWWRKVLGYSDCSLCGKQAVRWHGVNPIHPDGPPIYEWWKCDSCGASTDAELSRLMRSVAEDSGIDWKSHPLNTALERKVPE